MTATRPEAMSSARAQPAPAEAAAGAGARSPAGLQIAGLVPLSTVDWPGRLAATIFLQGCPWQCVYCHNVDLIPPRRAGTVAWEDVVALLRRRRGLLDGLVFSGGEATRQPQLPAAMREVRELGLGVGLHTAGPYPHRLAAVVPLVDWVGLDLKALPEDYPDVAGRPGAGELAWRSLRIVLEAGVDHEIRTTIHPGSPAATGALEIARRARAAGARVFALQQARAEGTRPGFVAEAPGWDEECQELARRIEALGFETFTYRSAHG